MPPVFLVHQHGDIVLIEEYFWREWAATQRYVWLKDFTGLPLLASCGIVVMIGRALFPSSRGNVMRSWSAPLSAPPACAGRRGALDIAIIGLMRDVSLRMSEAVALALGGHRAGARLV